jgi:hypothetical protein
MDAAQASITPTFNASHREMIKMIPPSFLLPVCRVYAGELGELGDQN